MTIHHYSRLFASIPTIRTIRYSRLFAIRVFQTHAYILYLFRHGKTLSIYYSKKFYYNYTVLQDCRVGAQPGATI